MAIDDEDRLSGAAQENLLACLCFDPKYALLIRPSLTVRHFESSVMREIAGMAIDFLDQYHAPIGDHLPDHLEHILKGDDERKAKSYENAVVGLFAAKDGINGEYILTLLHKFVRQQGIKSAIRGAVEALEDGRIDDAEVEMQRGLHKGAVTFEAGINLADPDQAMSFLDENEKPFLMGTVLDKYGIGPARKTFFLLNGALGMGKSWGLIHIGKYALIQRLSVCHLTLEMSAEKTAQRYLQAMFSITKAGPEVRLPRFKQGFDGSSQSIEFETLLRPTMQDEGIRSLLRTKIERNIARRASFHVKKFPSGSLTMQGLRAYADGLERYEGITPDVWIIDYPELMALGAGDLKRGSIGQLFVDLRGFVDERNAALVGASQVNRTGMSKTTSDATDLSEDISKGFTVDRMVTYNQTPMEKKLGIARLFVAKNRDDESGMTALITQNYASGQFCIDSMLMNDRYLPSLRGGDREDEDDEPPPPRRGRVRS